MDITQDQSGNFLNPSYVTPQQAQQLREYSQALQKGSIADTSKSWTGALAQALMGLQGGRNMNQANQQQRQLAQQSTDELNSNSNPLVAALLKGLPQGQAQQPPMQYQPSPQSAPQQPPQGPNPNDIPAGVLMPPGQNLTGPNTNITGVDYGPISGASSFSGSSPSGAGNPISQALMGKPMQMAQNQPSGSIAGILSSPSIPAEVKKQILEQATPKGGLDAMGNPVVGTTMGGLRPTGVGQGVSTGVWKPQSVTTPNASVSGEQLQSTQGGSGGFSGNANKMMDVAEKVAGRGAVLGATTAQTGQDFANMNNAIPQIQVLKTMRDSIKNSPTMQFGPTAPWLTNLQMGIANSAPGLFTPQQMHDLAAANGVDKLTAQLGNILSTNGSGTDAKLFNNLQAVPGRGHNSKEGMLDLIDMLIQQQAISHQFVSQNMNKISQGMSPSDFTTLRNGYFDQHPIINPATQNPIRLDLTKNSAPAPETKTIGNKTYQKINGVWHEGT